MKKAFPRFGLSSGIRRQGHAAKSTRPLAATAPIAQARMTLCASRQAIFVPLLAHERELQSSMTSSILARKRTLGSHLASELRSQHAQIGSIVYILSQQYELHPTPTHSLHSGSHLPHAAQAPSRPLVQNEHVVSDLIGKHQGIIRSIESLAREFSGSVRGAMILGHIAQRHREMAATLGKMVRSLLGRQA